MDAEEIVEYCLSRKGMRHEYKETWEADVFFICDRMFALLGGNREGLPALALKCDPEEAISLREQFPDITPAYHMNKQHWNSIALNNQSIPNTLMKKMIDDSYRLVVDKLPRKLKSTLSE
ncbi:MmcQ/YjbR family DNA-binding protein [Porphyromonadaceae bacterium OttesenSCG-928-L07]|nr:MmcQ/YjbR family DNA-binding protein [Porphyromonadaceae bacterium OttesenSCG-928-L07]MDL2252369.1 MmcQ/YjbR family DNA-binding protein [Odoribacter sp. OttesenSCG-928-J03]